MKSPYVTTLYSDNVLASDVLTRVYLADEVDEKLAELDTELAEWRRRYIHVSELNANQTTTINAQRKTVTKLQTKLNDANRVRNEQAGTMIGLQEKLEVVESERDAARARATGWHAQLCEANERAGRYALTIDKQRRELDKLLSPDKVKIVETVSGGNDLVGLLAAERQISARQAWEIAGNVRAIEANGKVITGLRTAMKREFELLAMAENARRDLYGDRGRA